MRSTRHSYSDGSLGRKGSMRIVGLEDFDREIVKAGMPVLVLCMHQDSEIDSQIEVVETVTSETYANRLKVCLLQEECVEVFREEYGVGGTPTFLIFSGGRERNRLLGEVDTGTLKEFLSRSLSCDNGGKEEKNYGF